MAVNKIRGAFTVPRKGETFELRAGLVYGLYYIYMMAPATLCGTMLTDVIGPSMHTKGIHRTLWERIDMEYNGNNSLVSTGRKPFRRPLWP
jgi:hypothetical protein